MSQRESSVGWTEWAAFTQGRYFLLIAGSVAQECFRVGIFRATATKKHISKGAGGNSKGQSRGIEHQEEGVCLFIFQKVLLLWMI